MYKCIYCNSEDLTKSDIISYALTGAKLTRNFVCHEHNDFTNVKFEKEAIANLAFFRNTLGLTERSGNLVKYTADLIVDGMTLHDAVLSGRASIYDDKKRLFPVEINGQKGLVGNIEKLKTIKGATEDKIHPVDMSGAYESFSFDMHKLLASDAMLRTVAKISYEWYCYVNDINEFYNEYKEIVDCILLKQPVRDYVEICVGSTTYAALSQMCTEGSHGLFSYDDIDGYRYVIFDFWGTVIYKTRICSLEKPNTKQDNLYNFYVYNLDGEKGKSVFCIYGNAKIVSLPADKAVSQYSDYFREALSKLATITILSLSKVNRLVDEVKKAFAKYKETNDFLFLTDYESPKRYTVLKLIVDLYNYKENYSFEISFNENLKKLYGISDNLVTTEEEKKQFLQYLYGLHNNGELITLIEEALDFFDTINEHEHQKEQL